MSSSVIAIGLGMTQHDEPPNQSKVKLVPVYQIDFTAIASGKHVAASKRRVRWRFGFANMEALEAGETGTACRGEEHDVTLVWSITSGKRLILADGHEVHYSMVRGQTFEFSWTMKGNHVLKVVAHAAPPPQRIPGFRQYDFFVDGKSFFTMPKVYRLGMAPNVTPNSTNRSNDPIPAAHRSPTYNNYSLTERDRTTPITALETPLNAEEERAYLEEAIKNSLQDSDRRQDIKMGAPAPSVDDLMLIDFGDERPVSVAALQPSHGSEQVLPDQRQTDMVPSNPFGLDPGYYHGQSSASLQVPSSYYPGQSEASLPTPTATYTTQPFGFNSGYYQGQSSGSLQSPAPASPFVSTDGYYQAPTNAAVPTPVAASSAPFGFNSGYYQGQSNASLGGTLQVSIPAPENPFAFDSGMPTVTPTNFTEQQATIYQSSVPSAAATRAYPSQQNPTQQKTGPKLVSGRSAEEAYQNLLKSDFSLTGKTQAKNPFDFPDNSISDTSGWGATTRTTLGQMQAVKKNEPKKEIMKSTAPAAGAMVVSTNQQGNWSGNGNQNYGAYGANPVLAGQQYQAPQQMMYQQQPHQLGQFQQQPQQYQQQPQQPGQYHQQPQQFTQQPQQYPQYNSGQQPQYNQFQQGH